MKDERFLKEWYRHSHYHAVVARAEHDPAACRFMLRCCREFSGNVPRAGVELCCGSALLSRDLAARGVAMTAVDVHPEVVEHARQGLPQVQFEVASMVDYRSPSPVDLVTNVGNNLSVLWSWKEMVAHLRAVADSLKPGGLYFCHLSKAWIVPPLELLGVDPPWLVYRYPEGEPNVGTEPGIRVEIDWSGSRELRLDPLRQLFRHRLTMTIQEGQEHRRLEVTETGRLWYPQEFLAAVEFAGGYELLGWFHDYRWTARADRDPQGLHCLAVLRRR